MSGDNLIYRLEHFASSLKSLMNGENPYGKIVSIQELADGIGMTRQAITKYLNIGTDNTNVAVPSVLVLSKISDYFGVSPNYLLGYDTIVKEDLKLKMRLDFLRELGIDLETYQNLISLNSLPNNREKQVMKRMINASINGMIKDIKGDKL